MRVGKGISLPDARIIYPVQEHVHRAKRPGLLVHLLTIDGYFAAWHLLIRLEQQAAAAASGIVDAVVLTGLHQRRHQLGNLAWREKLAALLPRIGGKHGDHVFIGVPNDVCGAQLAGAQVEAAEILQQVAQGRILFFRLSKVRLRIEVNGPEYIAKLSAVMVLNLAQGNIDLLPDLRIIAVVVKIIKGGLLVQCKPLAAHGPLNAAQISLILPEILLPLLFGNIA